MDIKGVNYLKCNRKDCFYNVGNECQCMTVFLNENGVCSRVKYSPIKRYKVISHKKKQIFKPMVNIHVSESELNEAFEKLIKELQRKPLTIMPNHIEDNIYYMSKGAENDNLKSK